MNRSLDALTSGAGIGSGCVLAEADGRLEYGWGTQDPSIFILHFSADHAAAEEQATALIGKARARLEKVARQAQSSPAAREAARLEKAHAEAIAQRNAAQTAQTTAASQARAVLSRGDDPGHYESAAEQAAHEVRVLAARCEHLGKLLQAARKKAQEAANAALNTAWQALLDESAQRRKTLLGKAIAALDGPLAELLANDLAETQLLDAGSGGVPADIVALLDPSRAEE